MAQSEGQSVAAGGAADHLGVDEHVRASRRRDRKHSNDAQSRKLIAGVLAALFGGAFWGLSGTCASYLFDVCHLDTMWLLAVRQLAAGALFMIVILATDRARFVKLLHNKRHLGIMVVFTFLGIFANQLFYLVAARMTNAGTATVLQCLQLVLIMGYTCIRSRRTPRPREIAGLVLALVALVVICTFLAYMLYMQGVKDIGSVRASLIGTVEPVSATITSALYLGTVFAPTDIIGFICIIVMVFLTV